jgi:hypothetical protein
MNDSFQQILTMSTKFRVHGRNSYSGTMSEMTVHARRHDVREAANFNKHGPQMQIALAHE